MFSLSDSHYDKGNVFLNMIYATILAILKFYKMRNINATISTITGGKKNKKLRWCLFFS